MTPVSKQKMVQALTKNDGLWVGKKQNKWAPTSAHVPLKQIMAYPLQITT